VSEQRLKVGQRVECRKIGPFQGKRGRIEDIWMGQALVSFQKTSITEPLTSFERV